jgi:flagellar hook-length control protein FliK
MQTTTLPIQANGAAPAPQRQNPAPNFDAGQFSAALSREIEQRQETAAPAPAHAPQPKPAARHKEAQADGTQTAADAKSPAQEPAKADDAKPAAKSTKADDAADAGKDDAKTAEHPDTAHVTDMLALVASLKPLQNAAAAKTAGETAAAAIAATGKPGATIGQPGAEAAQLAALQAAVKSLGKDDAAQPGGKVFAAPADAATAAAALGAPAADAADAGAGTKGAIDLRAFQEAAAGQFKAHPDAAPAREALADVAALKEPAPAAQLLAQAQPVTFEVAQAVAGDRIAARVGTPAWDNQVGQKIVWMAAGEEQSASLTLNPPDLGPLQVVLSVTNDQATVAFSSNQQEVRQALENALPRLREMMGESGIALGNASVNAGMPEQRQAHGGEHARAGAAPSSRADSGPAIADVAARPVRRSATLGDSGVDTFA